MRSCGTAPRYSRTVQQRTTTLTSRAEVRELLRIRRPLSTLPHATAMQTVQHEDGVLVRSFTLVPPDGEPVPCLYLTPDAPGPRPGVVAVHQHNAEFHLGKSEPAGLAGDSSLAYGIVLARLGAAVLVPDLRGFEERRRPRPDGTGEQLDAFHLLTVGTTLQARHVEDVALCVTWLVDQGCDAVGIIGHSLGGQVAFFAAACDERLRAAVISCGLATVASFARAGVLHNAAWYVPDLVAAGDCAAVAAVTSGQSFWVSAGDDDPLFPPSGVREAVGGFPEGAAVLRTFAGPHSLPPELMAEASHWLISILALGDRDPEPRPS